jgi:hypothetical protein
MTQTMRAGLLGLFHEPDGALGPGDAIDSHYRLGVTTVVTRT